VPARVEPIVPAAARIELIPEPAADPPGRIGLAWDDSEAVLSTPPDAPWPPDPEAEAILAWEAGVESLLCATRPLPLQLPPQQPLQQPLPLPFHDLGGLSGFDVDPSRPGGAAAEGDGAFADDGEAWLEELCGGGGGGSGGLQWRSATTTTTTTVTQLTMVQELSAGDGTGGPLFGKFPRSNGSGSDGGAWPLASPAQRPLALCMDASDGEDDGYDGAEVTNGLAESSSPLLAAGSPALAEAAVARILRQLDESESPMAQPPPSQSAGAPPVETTPPQPPPITVPGLTPAAPRKRPASPLRHIAEGKSRGRRAVVLARSAPQSKPLTEVAAERACEGAELEAYALQLWFINQQLLEAAAGQTQ
jgi:hypothetical protein